MKNIQVIDGALNCVYDVFAVSDEDHALLFPDGTDIAFVEDFESRPSAERIFQALERAWRTRVPKAQAMGIHGIVFYGLSQKRQFYPTLRDEEARNPRPSRRPFPDGYFADARGQLKNPELTSVDVEDFQSRVWPVGRKIVNKLRRSAEGVMDSGETMIDSVLSLVPLGKETKEALEELKELAKTTALIVRE